MFFSLFSSCRDPDPRAVCSRRRISLTESTALLGYSLDVGTEQGAPPRNLLLRSNSTEKSKPSRTIASDLTKDDHAGALRHLAEA